MPVYVLRAASVDCTHTVPRCTEVVDRDSLCDSTRMLQNQNKKSATQPEDPGWAQWHYASRITHHCITASRITATVPVTPNTRSTHGNGGKRHGGGQTHSSCSGLHNAALGQATWPLFRA